MVRVTRALSVVALALLFGAGRASAQDRPIELGFDGAILYQIQSDLNGLSQPNVLSVSLPFQLVRAGFFVSDAISIEPALGFAFEDTEDVGSLTALDLLANVLYHFPSAGGPEFFVKAGGVFSWANFSPDTGSSDSSTQFGLGAGAGVKLPIVDRLKFRLGLNYIYQFESKEDGLPASSNIFGTFGLSLYTR
jgi:opacity protein-like surface antigen